MKTVLLTADSEENLHRAADVLARGGLVAFPTDTVYGLAASAFNTAAVQRIYIAKQRPPEKAIPVLIGSSASMHLVAATVDARAAELARHFWPGPLTIVVPKNPQVPEVVSDVTVGIRVPDHPIARNLLELSGPLAVTSANLSGQANPSSAAQVIEQLDGRIDLVLDGGRAPGGLPSTVVDCTGPDLRILRSGPLSLDELRAAIG